MNLEEIFINMFNEVSSVRPIFYSYIIFGISAILLIAGCVYSVGDIMKVENTSSVSYLNQFSATLIKVVFLISMVLIYLSI